MRTVTPPCCDVRKATAQGCPSEAHGDTLNKGLPLLDLVFLLAPQGTGLCPLGPLPAQDAGTLRSHRQSLELWTLWGPGPSVAPSLTLRDCGTDCPRACAPRHTPPRLTGHSSGLGTSPHRLQGGDGVSAKAPAGSWPPPSPSPSPSPRGTKPCGSPWCRVPLVARPEGDPVAAPAGE